MFEQGLLVLLALIVGAGIGVFYFGGLWWTVRRVAGAKYPAFLTIGSFFGRSLVVCAALYAILQYGHWGLLLAALVGFTAARFIIVRRVRQPLSTS